MDNAGTRFTEFPALSVDPRVGIGNRLLIIFLIFYGKSIVSITIFQLVLLIFSQLTLNDRQIRTSVGVFRYGMPVTFVNFGQDRNFQHR